MPMKFKPQPPQDRLRLPGGEATDFRRAGAGREGGIERVDVETEIHRGVADDVADFIGHGRRAPLVHVLRGDDGDALRQRPVVDRALDRGADADLHHTPRLDQSFVDGVIEHRAVRIDLAEIVGPGVNVGVEMNECARAAPLRERAQERQRDAVLAAERDEVRDRARLSFDQREACGDIAECDAKNRRCRRPAARPD